MSWHDEETIGSVHIPYNWEYANAAARTGASGFVAADVGKFARQLDDNSIWMLTATTPTWIAVGSGGMSPESFIEALGAATDDPTGFENQTDSAFTWTDTGPDRTLAIAPDSSEFKFRVLGELFTKTGSETKQITDTEGLWYFYYDSSGVLQATQTFSISLITSEALVAIVYWDAVNGKAIRLLDERHGLNMHSATHVYLHLTRGLALQQNGGFTPGNVVIDGDGDSDAHAQFSLAVGTLWDEDVQIAVTNGTGSARFEQRLDQSNIAWLPVLYRDGADASSIWRKETTTAFPVTKGAARLKYNLLSGGNWTSPDVSSNGDYVLCHIFGTNDVSEPITAIRGQAQYVNAITARAGAQIEMQNLYLAGLPGPEMRPLFTFMFQTATGYTNTVAGRVRPIDTDDTPFVDWRGVSVGAGGIAGGTDQNAIHDNGANEIDAITEKTSPVDDDLLLLEDSAASYVKKKLKVSNLPGGGYRSDYVEGLHISNNATDAEHDVDIASGRCFDEDQSYDMLNAGTLTPAIDTTGANGRDASDTLDANTFYFVYLIEKSSDGTEAGFFSKSSTWAAVGTKPTDYDKGRCIGVVLTDASADIHAFKMPVSKGFSRWIYYDVASYTCDIEYGGTSASYVDTTTDASDYIPLKATQQLINVECVGSSAYASSYIRPNGWSGGFFVGCGNTDGSDPYTSQYIRMPVASDRLVEYSVTDAETWIDVRGFEFTI